MALVNAFANLVVCCEHSLVKPLLQGIEFPTHNQRLLFMQSITRSDKRNKIQVRRMLTDNLRICTSRLNEGQLTVFHEAKSANGAQTRFGHRGLPVSWAPALPRSFPG